MVTTIYRDLDPAKLRPHPKSQAIYQDSPSDELQKSVAANGVLDPLILAADEKTIISGRRRRMAAIACKRKTVPCVIRKDLSDELDIREALLESNIRNDRTTEQRAREYQERMSILAARAAANAKAGRTPSEPVGRAKAEAAKAVGMGRQTADAALEVLEKAAAAEAAGQTELAEQIVETLNTESVAAAVRLVGDRESKKPDKTKPSKSSNRDEVVGLGKAKVAYAALVRHMPREVYKECKQYLKIIEQKLELFSPVK